MLKTSIVQNNPNPNIATFSIDADLMGSLSKVIFTSTGTLANHSNLARQLFKGGVVRTDFTAQDGSTFISLSKKFQSWSKQELETIKDFLNKFINESEILDQKGILNSEQVRTPFNAAGNPVKNFIAEQFLTSVSPALASHGGSMEIIDIEINKDGQITVQLAMLGSCQGCHQASEQTLSAAMKLLQFRLEQLKEQYAENPSVQKLHFADFNEIKTSDLALLRAA